MPPQRSVVRTLAVTLVLAALGAGSASAQPYTIDFDDLAHLTNGAGIPAGYGSEPGVAVTHGRHAGFGNTAEVPGGGLCYWQSGYSNLQHVAYGCGSPAAVGQFSFQAGPGSTVFLNSLQLGAWSTTRTSEVRIYSWDWSQVLYASGPQAILTAAASTFAFNVSSSQGLHLQWGMDPYYVGIDNISYTVRGDAAAVPEPVSMLLLGTGVLGVGLMRRRRRIA